MRRFQADVASRDQKREVSAMPFMIRPLRVDEAALYRDVRLEGLRAHPESFSATFEQEAAQPLTFFTERLTGFTGRLTGGGVFGGFRDQTLLGIVGFAIQAGAKREHKGMLWGMYVRPDARGSGLARGLVEALLEHARDRVELVQLTVTADNLNASRLYASLGFQPYGIEERALKIDGRYLDEVLMAKRPP
jgi:ribosomal protein S18 acetylase RimI-like enzyme